MQLWFRPGSPSLTRPRDERHTKCKTFHVQESVKQAIVVFRLGTDTENGQPLEPLLVYPLDSYPSTPQDIKDIYRAYPDLLPYARSTLFACRVCHLE